MYRRSAELADNTLRGTKPAEIRVEQPMNSISRSIRDRECPRPQRPTPCSIATISLID